MPTMPDPFDFSDITDLPPDLQKAVSKKAADGIQSRTVELIRRAGKSVSAAELRAAYFRVYGEELGRAQALNALLHMSQQGRLIRTGVGRYGIAATDKAT